jgi:hypothetical protein
MNQIFLKYKILHVSSHSKSKGIGEKLYDLQNGNNKSNA